MGNSSLFKEHNNRIQESGAKISLVVIKRGTQEIPSSSLFFEQNPVLKELFIPEWIRFIENKEYWLNEEKNIFEKLLDWLNKKMLEMNAYSNKFYLANIEAIIEAFDKYGYDTAVKVHKYTV